MDDKILQALYGSIQKWEDIRDGKIKNKGPNNCPLCQLFSKDKDNYSLFFEGKLCVNCPIFLKINKKYCSGTPYTKFVKAAPVGWATTEEQKKIAQEEIDFLKSLLPKEEKMKKGLICANEETIMAMFNNGEITEEQVKNLFPDFEIPKCVFRRGHFYKRRIGTAIFILGAYGPKNYVLVNIKDGTYTGVRFNRVDLSDVGIPNRLSDHTEMIEVGVDEVIEYLKTKKE